MSTLSDAEHAKSLSESLEMCRAERDRLVLERDALVECIRDLQIQRNAAAELITAAEAVGRFSMFKPRSEPLRTAQTQAFVNLHAAIEKARNS